MDHFAGDIRRAGNGGAVPVFPSPEEDRLRLVYTAGGALLGGFTATVWYPVGPVVAGLYILPALAGAVVLGAVAEFIYRAFIRPHQTA
jgi:hypothetical protein